MEAKEWEIWVKVGGDMAIPMKTLNTTTVGEFFIALTTSTSFKKLGAFDPGELVVRAPLTAETDVDPATWAKLNDPEATLVEVLKPIEGDKGRYRVYVELPAKVEAAAGPAPVDPVRRFEELCGEKLGENEKMRVVFHCLPALPLLHTSRQAIAYLAMFRSTMYSMTLAEATRKGYLINGPMDKMYPHVQTGLDRKGNRCVFKTCPTKASGMFELHTMQAVHALLPCDFLCAPIELEVIHEKHVLVMPDYGISAQQLAVDHKLSLPERWLLNVAGSVGAALCGIHLLNKCWVDIKPGNIVLGPRVVLVDGGSVTEMGNKITTGTPQYSMDVPKIASIRFDLTCLASTLFQLATGTSSIPDNRDESCNGPLSLAQLSSQARTFPNIWSYALWRLSVLCFFWRRWQKPSSILLPAASYDMCTLCVQINF